jgi:hypothetical protein
MVRLHSDLLPVLILAMASDTIPDCNIEFTQFNQTPIIMLTEKDFAHAAQLLGCDIAAIKAVNAVEAPRGAFDEQGRLTILFEPARFWKALLRANYTARQLQDLQLRYPKLLSPFWNPALYGLYREQWDKLNLARTINANAATESASYGAFQIMGENYTMAGYTSADAMVTAFGQSELNQLLGFVNFVKSKGLDVKLKNHDWAGFAYGYNGSGYAKNEYDKKLASVYLQFKLAYEGMAIA